MSIADIVTYVVRPDGTALWVTGEVREALRLRHGDHLTREQYDGPIIQGLIARRLAAEKQRKQKANL